MEGQAAGPVCLGVSQTHGALLRPGVGRCRRWERRSLTVRFPNLREDGEGRLSNGRRTAVDRREARLVSVDETIRASRELKAVLR